MKIQVEVYPDELLRLVRSRLEMTQAEFADRWGFKSYKAIMRYENGVCKIPEPKVEELKRMADEVLP